MECWDYSRIGEEAYAGDCTDFDVKPTEGWSVSNKIDKVN